MTPDERRRVKAITADALEHPPELRRAFVVAACEGNESLRIEVEQLLESAEAASELYEGPFLSPQRLREALTEAINSERSPIGSSIGPYRIGRELGHGGMGRVYLAERTDGEFDQRVAIKFVDGVPTDGLLRRFRDERRILATLDHPNIARLIDGGATRDRDPYVIMEYVEGIAIDAFCEAHALRIDGRLRLFLRVCDAVAYAHQRLVVHRDLKASNILVTADGTPKLLDFGIAKLLTDSLPAAETTRTLFRAMTPETASPEQIRGEPVTTATDVYALGVLLYRLLSGQSPYGLTPLTEAALLRAICDEMPSPPSAARRAGPSAPALERTDADLDAIVLKALRKEPERRYRSVQQFAEDVDRYLRRLPVLAGPDSRRYRAGKFVRRHRVLLTAGTVAALAILIAAAVALHQARIAAGERARAEKRFTDVRQLANSFLFEFHDSIAHLPGSLAARRLVVQRAAEHLDMLSREASGDVMLQRELADANTRLADILGGGGVSNLGDLDGAESRYRTALAIRTTLASQSSPDPADLERLARLRVHLARFEVSRNDLEEAEQHARAAIEILRALPSAGQVEAGVDTTVAYRQLGFVQARRGKTAEALASLESARARAQQVLSIAPNDVLEERLIGIETDYAEQLVAARRPQDAIPMLADARSRLDRLISRDPLNNRYAAALIYALNTEAGARHLVGDHDGGFAASRQALSTASASLTAEPTDTGMRVALLLTESIYGQALLRAGHRAEAIRQLRAAIDTAKRILATAPGHQFVQHQLVSARVVLGEALLASSRDREAGCRELAEGLRAMREAAARGRLPGETAPALPRLEALLARHGCAAGRRPVR